MTRHHRSAGMVTAELALGLPVLAVVVVFGIGAVHAAGVVLRCQDAAREGARAVARGDPVLAVEAAARAAGPPGASVHVVREGDDVRIEVSADVPLLGMDGGPSWHAQGAAVARDVEGGTG